MKSMRILLLAVAITSSTMATVNTAPLSMPPSPPASATANTTAEREKMSFADTSEQDFSAAPSLNLGAPTAAESKSFTPPKQGAPAAIGFRRATMAGSKVFSAQPGITLQGSESGVAKLSVLSGTAKALRVALDLSTLPADASIAVRGSDEFTRIVVAGRVADLRKLNTADGYWTPTTQGERQYIQIMLPQVAGKAAVTVRINAVSHITIALSQLNTYALNMQKVGQSGSCESNVVCQTGSDVALANTATSVARMIFTDAGSSFLCSGTLLNDTNTSYTPNFYSAHHCISTQVVASSLNTFWFYDSPTCPNGTTVGSFVQLTGGAIYLFSDATIDGLLLRLNDAVPAGAVLAGWDANALADGASIVGIHHPAGDVKKVSRGLSKAAGCAATRSCVGWSQGTTEGGSSGSGLFTFASNQYYLRGGLYGGSSTCGNTGNVNDSNNTDQYSRLSAMYASISQYLAPPAAASNNNFVNALNLSGLPASATGTNVSATKETGEPNHPTTGNVGGASVWWNWIAPSSGVVKVSTAGSGFDTTLGVYTGNAVNALTRVSYTEDYSDDTLIAATSSVSFQASAGVTYRIAVDGYKSSAAPVATGSVGLAITPVVVATAPRASDLSGDGRSDIIWNYGVSGGGAAVWLMNGVAATSNAGLNAPSNWRVVATGDFNGDGKADLLWYNRFTGQTAIWLMNGIAQIGSAVIFSDASGGWLPVAAGDTNGDGRADIIWWNQRTGQSAIWLMNGLTQMAGAVIYTDSTGVPNASGWRPVATGDFNGDGRADILWYNQYLAQTGIWLMNGMTTLASKVIYSDVQYAGSPYWTPVAAGDNDGDGKADILWYNQFTGQTAIWHMNGLNQIDSAVVYTDASSGLGWQPVGFGDYNGDGRSDILWYHPYNRQAAIWLMNGFTTLQGALIYTGGDLWRPL